MSAAKASAILAPSAEAKKLPKSKSAKIGKTDSPGVAKTDATANAKKAKALSALDAAAKVLADEGKPMNCPELIELMTKKGLWTSPNGLTPAATLYAAILREIKVKGAEARFVKTERGKFSVKATA
jgi:hypothetical protein